MHISKHTLVFQKNKNHQWMKRYNLMRVALTDFCLETSYLWFMLMFMLMFSAGLWKTEGRIQQPARTLQQQQRRSEDHCRAANNPSAKFPQSRRRPVPYDNCFGVPISELLTVFRGLLGDCHNFADGSFAALDHCFEIVLECFRDKLREMTLLHVTAASTDTLFVVMKLSVFVTERCSARRVYHSSRHTSTSFTF